MKLDFMSSLFPVATGTRALSEGPGWNSLFSFLSNSMKSAAGVSVTAESAMRQTTVYACVRVLAETVAQLPIRVYKRNRNGTRSIAYDHPLNTVLGRAPNPWKTSFEFREMMEGHLALRGNAYARIVPGVLGSVTELWPWHPDRVTVSRLDNGRLRYELTQPNGQKKAYAQDEVFHVRGLSTDGLVGLSPIAHARDSIGLGLAAERYGSALFANSARPSGLLSTEGPMKPQDAKLARDSFHEAYGGEREWHKTAVLWGGLKYQAMSMTNDEAQFLETRRLQREEIASIFRVPQHMVGILDRSTNNNIEQQSLEFVLYTMLPWIRRWEEAICRDLIQDDETYYIKFNLNGLLRGDAATRAAFYTAMVNAGIMTPNECRELEDLDPYEGGDEHFMQGAMVPVSRLLNPPEPPALPAPNPEAEAKATEEKQMQAVELGKLEGQISVLSSQCDSLSRNIETRQAELDDAWKKAAEADAALGVAERRVNTLSEENEQHAAAAEAYEAALAESQKRDDAAAELMIQRDALQDELTSLKEQIAEGQRAKAALHSAADANLLLLTADARKMIRWEIDNALRASKKRNFIAECETFRTEHAPRFCERLAPLVEQRRILGAFVTDHEAAISLHLDQSHAALLTASECAAEELTSRVTLCVSNWEERADQLVQQLTTQEVS